MSGRLACSPSTPPPRPPPALLATINGHSCKRAGGHLWLRLIQDLDDEFLASRRGRPQCHALAIFPRIDRTVRLQHRLHDVSVSVCRGCRERRSVGGVFETLNSASTVPNTWPPQAASSSERGGFVTIRGFRRTLVMFVRLGLQTAQVGLVVARRLVQMVRARAVGRGGHEATATLRRTCRRETRRRRQRDPRLGPSTASRPSWPRSRPGPPRLRLAAPTRPPTRSVISRTRRRPPGSPVAVRSLGEGHLD